MVSKAPLFTGFSKVGIFFIFAANRDRKIEKTMVGFGRTEVSIPPF